MDATLWVKLRDDPALSWHIVGKDGATRCGHRFSVPSPSADDLPLGGKSCETCLRLVAHDAAKATGVVITDFDWCLLGDPPTIDSRDIWHAVRPESPTTVCGEAVANPDEEWRWVDRLGNRRICDNCGKLMARATDVEVPG